MKAKTMIVVTTLLMSSGLVLATGNTLQQKANHPNAVHPTAVGDTVQGGAPAKPGGTMPMKPMHKHLQKMQSQMAEINRTEDPDKRDELIQSHMANMQEIMKMMGGQQGDKMTTPQGGMMEMMNRQKMMEQRMDMMQHLMDQMMQNQAASAKTRKYRKWRFDRTKEK